MAEAGGRPGFSRLRAAQLLLVIAAGGLWAAARLPWVVIGSSDGLGQPRHVAVSGADWSTALLPLAVLSLVAAVAVVAVRGWALRALAIVMAAASAAAGYLAISLWVGNDVVARGADIADVPVLALLGGDRRFGGAALSAVAALGILVAAVLLMRSASAGAGAGAAKYVPPAVRRSRAGRDTAGPAHPDVSERMIWDALDEGQDPTDPGSG